MLPIEALISERQSRYYFRVDRKDVMEVEFNVLGKALQTCSQEPLTGFFRNGKCSTSDADLGLHTVCCIITDKFLDFTASRGNDLRTPSPEFGFEGLQAGDGWCLCAGRWMEAYNHGAAPQVKLGCTHIKTLELIPLATLKENSHE
jgi:uncharacterized protein (DUF2237 family)